MKELPARGLCNVAECGIVHFVLAGCVWVTDTDDVNGNATLACNLSRFARRHSASRIIAVCQQNEHSLFCVAAIKLLDGQTNRIADHCLKAGHAGVSLTQDFDTRIVVKRKGSYRI